MTEKPLILAVDRNRHNLKLMTKYLGHEGFKTLGVSSIEELDRAIETSSEVSLALIDLSGFDQSIWDRCDELNRAHIPFLVISSQRSSSLQQDSLKHGARGLLLKPLEIRELVGHTRTVLGE